MPAAITAIALALLLTGLNTLAHAQGSAHEDLSSCPGSAPEPGQSAPWSIAFCNRTGHDIVIEFHDNECPAKEWSRRGDVYQRTLRRGESKILPLCYASEPPGKKSAPGVPTVRIPGGKGVTTTWSVVGDCGDRSKPLNLDARTFYDRGEYKTGIILLQYPSGASHCTSDASGVGATSTDANHAGTTVGAPGVNTSTGAASGTSTSTAATAASGSPGTNSVPTASQLSASAEAQPPVATHSPIATGPAAAPVIPTPPTIPRSSGTPTLSAVIDPKSITKNAVMIFAKGGAGYECNFNLALTFTDGGTWNDREKVDIAGSEDLPIVTRKYLKSVTKAQITSNSCSPK